MEMKQLKNFVKTKREKNKKTKEFLKNDKKSNLKKKIKKIIKGKNGWQQSHKKTQKLRNQKENHL